MNNKSVLLLGQRGYDQYHGELKALGYLPYPICGLQGLNSIVCDHADTLIFDSRIESIPLFSAVSLSVETDYILSNDFPFGSFPTDTRLNALSIGGYIFARLDSLSPKLLSFAEKLNLKPINVRQGYARCAVLALNDASAITADPGLSKAMRSVGIEVLEISQGSIDLWGCEYGFIGGASAVDSKNLRVIFFGELASHPDGNRIYEFCKMQGFSVECLNGKLTDIGGGIVANPRNKINY